MPDTSQAREMTLEVGGLLYGGWKAAIATIGMDRVAGDYALEVTELWPGNDVTRKIRPGDECRLAVAGETVITGYVDAVDISFDGQQHTVSIRGRDRSADLIDCSAVRSPGQWRGQKVETIAAQLAQPFNVGVKVEADTGKPLTSFALQTGETVWEAIDRAARLRGFLVVSDGAGWIVFTRAGLTRSDDALVYGSNLLSARSSFDVRDRFSEYTALGQAAGNDYFSGSAAAHIKAQAKDGQIGRYRPLLITGDSPDAAGSLGDRVKWEATVRAARSTQVEVVVQGFTQSTGELWRPNTLTHVLAEPLRIDDDMLIASVTYEVSDRGTFTRLSLTRADAFTLQAIKEQPGDAQRPYFDKAVTAR